MSIEKINLRKLLQLFFADDRLQRSLLLADIRNDRTKEAGDRDSGGDFYGPFWADGSCPVEWCSWRRVTAMTGMGRTGQPAIAGRLTAGSSLKGAIVSRVM